jgi:hypothetical protein
VRQKIRSEGANDGESNDDAVAELHRVRDAFGDLLAARPEIRETVRRSHARYTEMVTEHRAGEKEKERRRLAKVREVLASGRLVERIKGNPPGRDHFMVQGLFPKELVKDQAPQSKRRKVDPRRHEAKLAKAALAALDWQERLASAPDEEERIRRWTEWTEPYRAGSQVEHAIHVGFLRPEGTEATQAPRHLDWKELRSLAPADRLAMAWTWLGGLWDALSLNPIVPSKPEPESSVFERVIRWIDDDAIRPRADATGSGVPSLDPK